MRTGWAQLCYPYGASVDDAKEKLQYDLYYLNVMAGPGERVWQICDDPAHAWVRGTWEDQPADPRLPLTSAVPAGSAETTPERSDS